MCQTWTTWVDEQKCQQEGACHLYVLRGEQHLSPVQAIGEDSAEQRKHHDGKLAQEEIQPR